MPAYLGMKPAPVLFFLAACFLSPARLWADDVDAIQSVIQSLNQHENLASLFTSKADMGDFDRLLKTGFADASRPWSEVTTPRITGTTIRFHTPQFAFVEGVKSQYGTMIQPRKVSIFFVLKKQGETWRIAYLKMNADFGLIPFFTGIGL